MWGQTPHIWSNLQNLPASAGNARKVDSTPELGRYPREGNGNPLQDSCLETSMDWKPGGLVCGLPKSWTLLSTHTRRVKMWKKSNFFNFFLRKKQFLKNLFFLKYHSFYKFIGALCFTLIILLSSDSFGLSK